MGASITKITDNKKRYLDLLLLGDEQESMIDRYLERGEMFVLEDDGVKAVCVVTGRRLINYLINHYSGQYTQMIVGTGEVPSAIAFYENCGFEYSHRIVGFFTQNYDHPIIDNGVLLKDMIYLKRKI